MYVQTYLDLSQQNLVVCCSFLGPCNWEPGWGFLVAVVGCALVAVVGFLFCKRLLSSFFSCGCLLASMARSVNCHGRKSAVQVHLIGAKPIVQVKR